MIIEKKCWPEGFQNVKKGIKPFEVRLDDFECQSGDVLWLREWDPNKQDYTGDEIYVDVTYILKLKDVKFWPKEVMDEVGLQVIGIKKLKKLRKKEFEDRAKELIHSLDNPPKEILDLLGK